MAESPGTTYKGGDFSKSDIRTRDYVQEECDTITLNIHFTRRFCGIGHASGNAAHH